MEKLLSVPELLKKSWALYTSRWWVMLLMGLVGWAGSAVIMGLFGLGAFATFALGDNAFTFNAVSIVVGLVGIVLLAIVNIWVGLALMHMIKEEYIKTGVWNTLMMVWNKMGSYAWVTVLEGLIAFVGFILLVIPGIIFSVWFAFSSYTFVFDGKRGKAALFYSRELVRGYWWPVFGRLLLFIIATMIVSMLTRIGGIINALFVIPFATLYVYVIYEDLKRVKNASLPMKAEIGHPL